MNEQEQILNKVREAAQKKVLFLPHALRQMLRPDRMIRRLEIRQVIAQGEIIEGYPNDPRGHSCLMLGFGDSGRALHICCAPKEDFLAVITAYVPDEHEWSEDFKVRVRK